MLVGTLITILVVSGIVLKNYLSNQLRLLLQSELSRQLEGEAVIHNLVFYMTRPQVEFAGIKLSSAKYGIDDLSIVNAVVRISPMPIFFGRIVISSVELGDTRLQMHVIPPRKTKAQKPPSDGLFPSNVQLIRFVIDRVSMPRAVVAVRDGAGRWDANFDINDLETDLQQWKGLRLKLTAKGELSTSFPSTGRERYVINRVGIDAQYEKDELSLNALEAALDGVRLTASGRIQPKLDLRYSVETDLAALQPLVPRHPAALGKLSGHAKVEGKATGTLKAPKVQGSVSARDLIYDKFAISSLVSNFEFAGSKLKLANLHFEQGDAPLTVGGEWDFKSNAIAGKLEMDRFPAQELRRIDLPLWKKLPTITGLISGSIGVQGTLPALSIEPNLTSPELTVKGENWSASLQQMSVALRAESQKSLADWDIHDLQLRSQQLNLNGQGYYHHGEYRIAVNGDLENSWQRLHRSVENLYGKVTLNGLIEGDRDAQHAELVFSGDNLRIGQQEGWKLRAQIESTDSLVRCTDLTLERDQGRMQAAGALNVKTRRLDNTRMQLQNMPADFLIAFLPATAEAREVITKHIDGTLSGEITAAGDVVEPEGQGNINVSSIRLYGEWVDNISLKSRFSDGIYDISALEIKKGKGRLLGDGIVDSKKGTIRFDIESNKLETVALKRLRALSPKSHPLDVKGKIFGSLKRPEVDARVAILDEKTPIVQGELTGYLDQPKVHVTMAKNPSTFDVELGSRTLITAKLVEFDPFTIAAQLGHRSNNDIDGIFSGEVSVHNDEQGNLDGIIRLDSIRVKQSGSQLLQQSTLTLEVIDNEIYLKSCNLQGLSSSFICTAEQGVEGYLNLSLLRAFLGFIPRSEGQVFVKAKPLGPITRFEFDGTLEVRNGVLTFKGFPTLLENIQVKALIKRNYIRVTEFSALAGGGQARGYGGMEVGRHWGHIDFNLNASVTNFPVRVPEAFPAEVTGNVKFTGPGTDALLQGDFTVNSVRYSKRFDWRSKLLDFGGRTRSELGSSIVKDAKETGRGVKFDLHLTANDPVIGIKNNVGDILMTGDFSVLGKFPDVGLRGSFNVASGKVQFQNQQFNIDSGVVEFNDPRSLVPFVDVYASAKVKEYSVSINIHTVNEQVQVDMSSNPPLNETDLLSLLTVGSVSSSYGIGSSLQQSGVTESLAVGIVSGTLQDKVERIGILDTFQVVPDYSQVSKSTELKLMLGKSLTKDLNLIYATDLYNAGTNQEMRLQQTVNKNFSVLGNVKNSETNQNVDVGADLEFSFDF